jgi:hypothetical protein
MGCIGYKKLKESTQEELGKVRRMQGDKQERMCHLVLKQKLDMMSTKMGEKIVVKSLVVKCSC